MPRYDYKCKECGEIEVEQKMSDNPLTKCPKCGNIDFNKMVSKGTGVIFKGSGFYENDYKIKKGSKE
jgi:putative FmdB family regulatory protein